MSKVLSSEQIRALENFYFTANHNLKFYKLTTFYFTLIGNASQSVDSLVPENIKFIKIGDDPKRHIRFPISHLKDLVGEVRSGDLADAMNFWCLANSVRAIAMAWVESVKDANFQTIVLADVFGGDDVRMAHFSSIMKFIRNCLSHNIQNEIELAEKDFLRQKEWWIEEYGQFSTFAHDYAAEDSAVPLKGYIAFTVKIDWYQVSAGKKFKEFFTILDLYLLSEFCDNMANLLMVRYRKPG